MSQVLRLVLVAFVLQGCDSSSDPADGGVRDPDGGSPDGGVDTNRCGAQNFPVAAVPPNVFLVLDKSGSMHDPVAPGTTETKWQVLSGAVHQLLMNFNGKARYGLSIFPGANNDDSCDPGQIDVAVGPNNEQAIESRVDSFVDTVDVMGVHGHTPTAPTLSVVRSDGNLNDTGRNNYVLLMTDGIPNCGHDPTIAGQTDAVGPTIAQLYASQPAVRTFVIGLGSETSANPELLNSWAQAGHTARQGAVKYYQASDAASLEKAFVDIVGGVATCTFKLNKTPDDPSLLSVTVDGASVATDPNNGASYDAGSISVELNGDACAKLRDGAQHKVEVIYRCPQSPIL
jgi:hypothetical protein